MHSDDGPFYSVSSFEKTCFLRLRCFACHPLGGFNLFRGIRGFMKQFSMTIFVLLIFSQIMWNILVGAARMRLTSWIIKTLLSSRSLLLNFFYLILTSARVLMAAVIGCNCGILIDAPSIPLDKASTAPVPILFIFSRSSQIRSMRALKYSFRPVYQMDTNVDFSEIFAEVLLESYLSFSLVLI